MSALAKDTNILFRVRVWLPVFLSLLRVGGSLGACVTTLCRIVSLRCHGVLCLGSIPRLSTPSDGCTLHSCIFGTCSGSPTDSVLTKRLPFPRKSPPRVETYNLTGVTLNHPSLFVQVTSPHTLERMECLFGLGPRQPGSDVCMGHYRESPPWVSKPPSPVVQVSASAMAVKPDTLRMQRYDYLSKPPNKIFLFNIN